MHQPRPPGAQPLAVLVRCGLGWTAPGLALIGLAAALRRTPVAAAVVAAFPVAYALVLGTSTTLYLRYLVPLAPFVALFAAGGACALAKLALPRRPGLALFAVVLVAAAGPLCQSTTYDLVLARPDTRVLAGAWIRAHVPPGSGLVLPDLLGYPNPVLPLTELQLHLDYGEFAAPLLQRGLVQSARVYQVSYVKPPFGPPPPEFQPRGRFVVAAYHPIVLPGTNMPPDYLRTLEALGARPVARFAGFAEPLPARAVFEPIDADYVPIAGSDAIERPGPELTIWELPATP